MEHRLTTTVATELYGNAVRTQTSPVRIALPYHRRRCRLALSFIGLPPFFVYRHFPDRLPWKCMKDVLLYWGLGAWSAYTFVARGVLAEGPGVRAR